MSKPRLTVLEGTAKIPVFFAILLCSSPFVSCQNNTISNLGNQSVGWQAGSNNRGTWDIISNCLATIIACTWSVQHLNVPGSSDGVWSRRCRSIKWMIVTILFPEFVVLHATFELVMAVKALQLMRDGRKSVHYPWWLQPGQIPSSLLKSTRSLWRRFWSSCATLRPFRGRNEPDSEAQVAKGGNTKPDEQNGKEAATWTLTHCFFANMGGICYHGNNGSHFPLTALQIAKDRDDRFHKPNQTEDDIQDRSKKDRFAKIIAASQFLQLALSLIVRTNQGIAFSQLETVTLGLAVCGAIIYLVYIYKPQNVETSYTISTPPLRYDKTFDSFWDVLTNKQKAAADPDTTKVCRIPNDNMPVSQNRWAHPAVLFLALASGLFGAMHAIAWDFEFPSAAEKLLWQSATVVAAVSPVVGLITIPLAQLTVPGGDAYDFLGSCLRLLREFSWHVREKRAVNGAYDRLEGIHVMQNAGAEAAQVPYKDIFYGDGSPQLARQLLSFLENTGGSEETPTFPKNFTSEFRHLVELMEGNDSSKKLVEGAKTNLFPQKSLLPKWFNLCVLYSTSMLYFLARLSLLGVALSSLRKMPASVYLNTPWTAYIPHVGTS